MGWVVDDLLKEGGKEERRCGSEWGWGCDYDYGCRSGCGCGWLDMNKQAR
jgi:hypothetical protein